MGDSLALRTSLLRFHDYIGVADADQVSLEMCSYSGTYVILQAETDTPFPLNEVRAKLSIGLHTSPWGNGMGHIKTLSDALIPITRSLHT